MSISSCCGFVLTLLLAIPVPAAAEAIASIESTWYIGEPIGEYSNLPKHYAFGPSPPDGMARVVTYSNFVPNVLVRIQAAAVSSDGIVVGDKSTEFFQQARTKRPTFCAVQPTKKMGHLCLIDGDGDGKFESSAWSKAVLQTPMILLQFSEPKPLSSPVSFDLADRDLCHCAGVISISYIGRRKMFSTRDATFAISIGGKKSASSGRDIPFDLDALPQSYEILGATFSNIRREGKILHFDLTSPIKSGPFEPVYGGTKGMEWGF